MMIIDRATDGLGMTRLRYSKCHQYPSWVRKVIGPLHQSTERLVVVWDETTDRPCALCGKPMTRDQLP